MFDVLFGDELEFDDLKQFRAQISDKIYQENTTIGDDWRWKYVAACIRSPLTNQPIALQSLIVLFACWQHPCIARTVRSQCGDVEFFDRYLEYLEYVMSDFCQSDPVYANDNWSVAFESLRRGWQEQDLQRPWNTLSVRDTGPPESSKRQPKRKQTQ